MAGPVQVLPEGDREKRKGNRLLGETVGREWQSVNSKEYWLSEKGNSQSLSPKLERPVSPTGWGNGPLQPSRDLHSDDLGTIPEVVVDPLVPGGQLDLRDELV